MRRNWMIGCLALILAATNAGMAGNNVQAAVHMAENAQERENVETVPNDTSEVQEEENEEIQPEAAPVTETEEEKTQTPAGQTPVDAEETVTDVTEEVPEEEEDLFEKDLAAWNKAKLNATYLLCAKSTSTQLSIKNIPEETTNYTILWKTSNKKIATVDNKGKVTAVKAGIAIISCYVKMDSGYEKRFTCEIEVTNPKFSQSSYVVAKGNQLQLQVTGTPSTKYTLVSSDDTLLKTYKKQPGLVKGRKEGTVTITAVVDGKTIQCNVIVSNPKIKKKLFVMTKEESAAIEVYNQSGKTKVTYTSKNPKIATVSSKGKITTQKIGVATILVTADGKEFEITVAVGHTKAVAAIKNAQKVLGAPYSQAYRMRKGYYDCSSLVWRCYVPTGITFGYSKYASNAPTAAGEAYYLVSHKKEVASTYVDEKKLKPGDLIFISSGYNGRYRNITHVAIYIGNDIIIHATPRNTNDVQYGTYSYYKNMIVSIGRPV